MTRRIAPTAASLAALLEDFEPLRRAERIVLRAAVHGDIARVGLRRPTEAGDELTVRAALLARLAANDLPARRLQVLGAWVEGPLDLGDRRVPASLWFYRCVFDAAPRLDGARLAGELNIGDCVLPGLFADRCRIAQDLRLAAGSQVRGEVRLQGARIGGDLVATRLSLRDDDDRSVRRPLLADRAHIAGDVRLDDGFEAHGEVRFVGARIGGDFVASRASLTGLLDADGVRRDALLLDRAEVGGHVRLDHGFAAAGRVCLRRTQIGGDLDCSGAGFDRVGDVAWGDGAALRLDRARVHGALRLCQLQGPLLGASFAGTRVGTLVDDATTWGERLVLDGFAYSAFGDGAPLDAPFRLAWLERQAGEHLGSDFRMHPWRRLIVVLARMGHGHSAAEVALRRERWLRRIGRVGLSLPPALRWLARAAHTAWGAAAGYGWRPHRLAGWSVVVCLAGAAGLWAAEQHGLLAGVQAWAWFETLLRGTVLLAGLSWLVSLAGRERREAGR